MKIYKGKEGPPPTRYGDKGAEIVRFYQRINPKFKFGFGAVITVLFVLSFLFRDNESKVVAEGPADGYVIPGTDADNDPTFSVLGNEKDGVIQKVLKFRTSPEEKALARKEDSLGAIATYPHSWHMNLLRAQMIGHWGKVNENEIMLTTIELFKLARLLHMTMNNVGKSFFTESAFNWKVLCDESSAAGLMQWTKNPRNEMWAKYKEEMSVELKITKLTEETIQKLLPHEQVILARYYAIYKGMNLNKKNEAWEWYEKIHWPRGGEIWYVDTPKKDDTYDDNDGVLDVVREDGSAGKDGKVTRTDIKEKMRRIPDIFDKNGNLTKIPLKYKKHLICKNVMTSHPEWFELN